MKNIIIILASFILSANVFAEEQNPVTTGTLNGATQTYDIYYGEVSPYNDVFYKFTTTENTTVSIILNYDGGDKGVFLFEYDNPTEELASNYGNEEYFSKYSDTIIYNCQADITYLIRVVDYEGLGGDFTLSLKDVTPFAVTANGNNGTVLISGGAGNTFIRNSECTVSAIPADCYRFVNWTEGGVEVSDDIEYAFIVNSNRNLVANFELKEYEIYSSAENGTITETQTVICGQSTTFTFSPDECYEFDKLYVDAEEVEEGIVNGSSYTFSNVTEGYTIFANFQIKTYNVTASTNLTAGGTATILDGGTNIPCGTPKTVVATPNTCYNFMNWTNENEEFVSEDNPYEFTVLANQNLVANFERIYPDNDACTNPTPLLCGIPIQENLIRCALPSTSYSQQKNYNDVFYSFTATVGNSNTITLSEFTGDKRLYVYPNCDATSALDYSTNTTPYVYFNSCSNAGNYLVRVVDCDNSGGDFTISLSYDSWKIGQSNTPADVTATFDNNTGTLTINADPNGDGMMKSWDNTNYNTRPWHCIRNLITAVYIEEGVKMIGNYAFYDCKNLGVVSIPNNVTNIGSHVFDTCSTLQSVTIPNSVINLGDHAFYRCSSLNSVIMSNSITYIGSSAFQNCKILPSITIPANVTTIYGSTFKGCINLGSVIIPNLVTTIKEQAFYGCNSLASLTIGENVENIEEYAFYSCTSLASVTIPHSVITIGKEAFCNCIGLASLTIGENVKYIKNGAFMNCTSLTSVTIPHSVITIGEQAFYNCSSLTSLTINDDNDQIMTNIGQKTFMYCTSLNEVTVYWTEPFKLYPSWNVFDGHPAINNVNLYVPQGSECAYKAASVWGNFNVVGAEVTITVSASPTVGGTVSGGGTKLCGASVTVTAIPNPNNCYTFKNWTKNGTIVSSNPSYEFKATDNCTLVANFEMKQPYNYNVIVSANPPEGGTVSGGNTNIPCGTENVTVEAFHNECYKFTGWKENGVIVSEENPYQFMINKNRNLIAIFEIKAYYDISVSASPEDGGIVSGGDTNIPCGKEITVKAIPNNDCIFTDWKENGIKVSLNPSYTFNATKSRNLVANFECTTNGIVETDNEPSLHVYPNPTNGELQVSGYGLQEGDYSIFNMIGQLAIQGTLQGETTTINVGSLPSGMYFLKIGAKAVKFVKE